MGEDQFYEDETANLLGAEGGIILIRLRQQMLMVYFLGDRFDGFMWFSNAGRGRATDPLTSKPQTGKP